MPSNITSYLMYVLVTLGAIFFVVSWFHSVEPGELEVDANRIVNPMLYYSYILLGICILVALMTAVSGAMANPSGLKSAGIGIGAFVAVIIISYVLASDEMIKGYPDDISSFSIKWSGVGLYAFYILLVGAIGSIIYSAVNRLIR